MADSSSMEIKKRITAGDPQDPLGFKSRTIVRRYMESSHISYNAKLQINQELPNECHQLSID